MPLLRFLRLSFLIFLLFPSALCAADSLLVVREVIVQGNHVTKEYVILREMSIRPGVELSQELIDHDRDRIYNLGLFNRVDVDYTERDSGAAVYVTVDERWYFFPFPIVGVRYRNLKNLYYGAGLSHQNFRGRNEKLFASLAFGYDRWFSLTYQNPKLTDDDDLFLTGSLALQRAHSLSPSDAMYLNTNISTWWSLGKRFGLYRLASMSLGYEVWQVSDPGVGRTASASGRDAFFSAGASYRYDTRNVREYATGGTFIQMSLTKVGIGDDAVDLTAFGHDTRYYVSIGDGAGIGFRSKSSIVWGGIVPPYRRNYFGYDDRIRGYFYRKVEAENTTLKSIELRVPILSPRYFESNLITIPQFRVMRYGLYLGLFADAGRAWSRHEIAFGGRWLGGAGAGLHFLLPYGFTIRTEAAVNDRGVGEGYVDFDVAF